MSLVKKYWWVVGLAVALLVVVLSPFASPDPDGLERVAEDQGFIDQAEDSPFEIIPDYVFPGMSESSGTVVAGLVGMLLVFGLVYGLAWILRRRASKV